MPLSCSEWSRRSRPSAVPTGVLRRRIEQRLTEIDLISQLKPAALLDQLLDPVQPKELGLGRERRRLGELVERDVGGDVLETGEGQVVLAR